MEAASYIITYFYYYYIVPIDIHICLTFAAIILSPYSYQHVKYITEYIIHTNIYFK